MKSILIASALLVGAMNVQAQGYADIGIGGVLMTLDKNEVGDGILRGVIGNEVSENFAVEALFAAGSGTGSDDEKSVQNSLGDLDVSIKHIVGVYMRPKMKFTDNFGAFARLGIADVKLKVASPWFDYEDRGRGFSYGLGLRYDFSPSASLAADYMAYYKHKQDLIDGITLSIGFKF